MRSRKALYILAVPLVLLLGAVLAYQLPPIHDRLSWRVETFQTKIQNWLNPPQEVVFVPQVKSTEQMQESVRLTLTSQAVTAAPVQPATATPAPADPAASPTAVAAATALPPTATATPTLVPTPIPAAFLLTGIRHEPQKFNNCGPTNLAMALSFWGWQGTQEDTRLYLRPNKEVDDKNIMPAEMIAYVEKFTQLKALSRVGGDDALLKRLIAAGFPVMVEMGHQPPDDFWMGHYVTINGYDDNKQRFLVQDSLSYEPDRPLQYKDAYPAWWRDFNYVYIVIYPPEREAEVLALLGPQADPQVAYRQAAERAAEEAATLTGRDQFFAYFNLGNSRVGLKDYAGAAEAFDQAFAIYPKLAENDRPYRLMWYTTGPYEAYYHTGRYQDVLNLAKTTLIWVGKQVLEETFYWRGLAKEALGDQAGAIADLKKAFSLNPDSTPALQDLQRLGVNP